MQLVNPDQRLELGVTWTLRETLSPEWSITGQDHSIWRKMPLGEQHLQQLSFSLMLTLGHWEAAWPVLLCCLHSPDSCKILTCLARDRLYSVSPLCFPTIPLILILVHNLSLLAKPSPQNRSRRERWSQKYPVYQGWPMQCRKTLHTGKEPQILCCCFSLLPPS